VGVSKGCGCEQEAAGVSKVPARGCDLLLMGPLALSAQTWTPDSSPTLLMLLAPLPSPPTSAKDLREQSPPGPHALALFLLFDGKTT